MIKIFKYIILFVFIVSNYQIAFWSVKEDNILLNAFSQRKDRILELINWWELETQINSLKVKLEKNELWTSLNDEVKAKLLWEIELINNEIINLNKKITDNIDWSDEFNQLLNNYEYEVKIKWELVEELNNSIKENELNTEKINVLLDKYINEKNKVDIQNSQLNNIKLYVFLLFTLWTILVYFLSIYLYKKWKIDSKRSVYINFFILFGYIIFLIWFFFYLYPELSIFLIFVSWYLLVINAHLVSSFIWSIIVLERFKIWDIIKFSDFRWQIIKITPLYVIILPLTDEGIFKNKPIYIPNINILKENVTKDLSAEQIIHRFQLTIREDSWIDIMKFVEEIEMNILTKFLHNKLASIKWTSDTFRTSFKNTNFWHIIVEFIWRDEDNLNKKVERKIMWYFWKVLSDIKKAKEESEKDEKNQLSIL
jgi:hypothetical protein